MIKHFQIINFLCFICLSTNVLSDEHESTENSTQLIVDSAVEEIKLSEANDLQSDALSSGINASQEKDKVTADSDTEETYEKTRGPAIGFVPESAIQQFQSTQTNKPTHYNLESIKNEIYSYESQKKYEKAIELLYEFTEKTGDEDSIIHLTRLLLKTNNIKQAEVVIKPLCYSRTPSWKSCFYLGTAQLMSNQLDNAAESLDRALLYDVEQAIVWQNRAIIEQERNKHQAALQLLSIAHKLKPENANIVLNLALSNEALDRKETAFQFYKQYLQLTKDSPEQESLRYSILSRLSHLNVVEQ